MNAALRQSKGQEKQKESAYRRKMALGLVEKVRDIARAAFIPTKNCATMSAGQS